MKTEAFGVELCRDLVPGDFGGRVGCVVRRVLPGSQAEETGELAEGDEVVSVNGIPMGCKTEFEVTNIMDSIRDEAEMVCRR